MQWATRAVKTAMAVEDERVFFSVLFVGTNRSYADVVRGTTGKSSNMTDAVRQPTVSGKW
jgi:hypothetical protein